MSLRKAAECVKKYKSFLITAHTNLEGDALGSELALCRLLKKLGKEAFVMNEDDIPYGYDFLPDTQNIRRYKPNIRNVKFDCFVAVDCSDLKRTGEVFRINKEKKPVLNIDHHISNEYFGDVNWVEPYMSSASEMIFRLYKKMRVPFDKEAALLLYVGILTDTGSFRYSNTSSSTHSATAELMKYGIDVVGVYRKLNENIPYEDIRLLAKILPEMRREEKGKIVWFQIPHNLLRNKKLSFDLSEHILTFARSVKDVEVCAIFKENMGVRNEIRVNFRSQGKVDVNRIAQHFGGGGHKTASGATIHGEIDLIRRKVLAKIKESL
ncbi:MAG: bifunctional oligoribonuclease/PAP phosphatase NrnA [Candidatus Omnitrophica bacterium]|nr:bifunctional oligoribonuclease/PAP phosphatase NrnA [Candidatus Omnitrophota bacterium]MBU1870281.1 bifunctional oligoribonuclease/PAP phosphatase NrnA [Candidatus Omnitrophota bacterium]